MIIAWAKSRSRVQGKLVTEDRGKGREGRSGRAWRYHRMARGAFRPPEEVRGWAMKRFDLLAG